MDWKNKEVSGDLEIIQIEIADEALRSLPNRLRNQLAGCMHAHNELTVLNRLLMFTMNSTGEGELHDCAQSIQTWSIIQLLAGKIFETWNMLNERFLKANPKDVAIAALGENGEASLLWLKNYFGEGKTLKDSVLRFIRDRSAFHYDKLDLEQETLNLAAGENRLYLAEHPANSVYWVGSSLVFRAVFSRVTDMSEDTTTLTHGERTTKGFQIAIDHAQQANLHMHKLLYGLMRYLLDTAVGKPLETLEQVRILVHGAPDPEQVSLPAFVNMKRQPPAR